MRHYAIPLLALLACTKPPKQAAELLPFQADTFTTAERVPVQRPVDGVVLPDGRLAIADFQADQLFILRPDGSLDQNLGRAGAGPGELKHPTAVLLRGDTMVVLNRGNNRVESFL